MTKSTGKRAAMEAETLHERFKRITIPGDPGECWEWPGCCTAAGYGKFGHHQEEHYLHRVSYEVHHGPIPEGLEVLHSCDNPPCWNPDHLSADTHAENMRQASERGLMHTGPRLVGVDHPLAKLDEEKVLYIRRSTASGVALAEHFGVAKSLISRVRQRRCWPHIA